MELKRYIHAPAHLFLPGAKYWVTGSAYKHRKYFKAEHTKRKMLEILLIGCEKFNWQLEDWVILDDHYHLMLQSDPTGEKTIADLMNNFHKFSAMWIRKHYPQFKKVKHIFYNYWDVCITNEASYYARLNYLFYNPVKHGYVDKPEDYPFGSYYYRIKEQTDYLEELRKKYPFDRLDLECGLP